jgi:hypothetical protein
MFFIVRYGGLNVILRCADRCMFPLIVFCRGHGGSRCRRLRGGLQAPAITRKADARATGYAVLARGTFDSEGRLPALAPLWEGEQRVLVALAGGSLLDGEVGIVLARLWTWRLLDRKRAWGRIHGIPQARGWLARRALVKRAERIEIEDAVGERPAGG